MFGITISIVLFGFTLAYTRDFDDSVKDGNKSFTEAVSRHDSIAIAALYHSNARVLPPNGEMVKGRDAIQDFWKGMMSPSVTGLKLHSVDTEKRDDLGVETGTYEVMGEHDATLDRGKYIVVWKKDDGKWKIYRDIWNSDLPPASGAAATQ
jgi:ketosteroid isomerase-like protein